MLLRGDFLQTKTSELDNWLSEALSDKIALGIDRFQQLKPIGYLGDPNGFTGTHMSYLAHESIFYNYEWNALLANKGDSKTKRRWLVGKRGNQEPWVKITEREKTPVALTYKQFKSDL